MNGAIITDTDDYYTYPCLYEGRYDLRCKTCHWVGHIGTTVENAQKVYDWHSADNYLHKKNEE